jgi:diaminohydroxyphosphoribosylaminopyrimidine deaminase/5-amino-6-(5-phosphoribosylamino)uracil reductase
MPAEAEHIPFMRHALALAQTHLGQTWPNPSVGAVVVQGTRIIGEGATARGGRPHAETVALAQAGVAARGGMLYVTLEPCAHVGKTPPCTDAIIASGIGHVIVACRDPHPQHSGGIERLRAAGIEVTEEVCREDARTINRGFFSVVEKRRPYIALKIATSSDGKIAGGSSRWITGNTARHEVHRLRARYDAVLTGIGTVLADNPMLNVRIRGLEDRSPVRVILDRNHRLSADSQIARTRDSIPTWVMDTPDLATLMRDLTEKGITRLLVEAGQTLNSAFLESGLVDRVYWFQAPEPIGEAGLDAFRAGFSALASWQQVEHTAYPPDTLTILEPCLPASSAA